MADTRLPAGYAPMWTRYWLGAGGVNPDKNVSLVVPPAQMMQNIKAGKMDGFRVGEPWNAKTIADGIGCTAITTQEFWKDHPEKLCAFTAEFAEKTESRQSRAQGAQCSEPLARHHGQPSRGPPRRRRAHAAHAGRSSIAS